MGAVVIRRAQRPVHEAPRTRQRGSAARHGWPRALRPSHDPEAWAVGAMIRMGGAPFRVGKRK